MTRLFVAVYPNSAAIEALLALPRPDTAGRAMGATRTLARDAEVPRLGGTRRGLRGPRRGAGRADDRARCSGPLGRLGRDALVVPVRGLERVASDVARCTAAFGRSADRPFEGHLTVARLRRWDRSGLTDLMLSASWPVDEVVLVESQLRPTGAVHTVVSRHPLAATGS